MTTKPLPAGPAGPAGAGNPPARVPSARRFPTLYADRPARRTRQIITDLLAVTWTYVWVMLAFKLYDIVDQLAVPGRKVEGAGNGLADNLSGVSDKIDNVPGVGSGLATPFVRAADAARALASAGQEQQQAVHQLALALAVTLVILPLGLVLFGWLPLRVRWIRRATAAHRLRHDVAGLDLLALRALATAPLRRLTALDPQIAAAWRRGDPAAVDRLAALELGNLGLR